MTAFDVFAFIVCNVTALGPIAWLIWDTTTNHPTEGDHRPQHGPTGIPSRIQPTTPRQVSQPVTVVHKAGTP